MQIACLALGIAVAQAIAQRTLAGERVAFAPIDAIDILGEDGRPAIAVYVGDSKQMHNSGNSLTGYSQCSIVIHTILPPSVRFSGVDAGLNDLANRSGGATILLAIIGRQITSSLIADRSIWSRVFNKLCSGVVEFNARPVIYELEGRQARFPAREMVLTCKVVGDPSIGMALEGVWTDFDGALREGSDPDLVAVANILKQAIEAPEGMSDYQKVLADAGLSWTAGFHLGLTPHEPPLPPDVPVSTLQSVQNYAPES